MYMPVIFKKQGEMKALEQLNNTNEIIPLVIINDVSNELLQSIGNKFSNHVILDTRNLSSDEVSDLIEVLDTNKLNMDIAFPPTALMNDTFERKIEYCIISSDNLTDDFFLAWIKEHSKTLPQNLIINVGFVNEDTYQRYADNVLDFINLIDINTLNKIYIVSGAIPKDLYTMNSLNQKQRIHANENFEIPRYDLQLFNAVKNNINTANLELIYGDYTVISPDLPQYQDGFTPIPIVQIKYTLPDKYVFVRNGQRKGNYSILPVCKEISEFSAFNSAHCWGDKSIQEIVDNEQNRRGNPSTWISIGVNHHIELCREEQNI